MAKVKITGHASGTGVLTVTAPNTSSDRTITLPDATGTLLNSDGDGSSLTNLTGPVDFSANAGEAGMTSELLDDYEEGTFSPTIYGATTTTYTTNDGSYVRIGKMVHVWIDMHVNTIGDGNSGIIENLPFQGVLPRWSSFIVSKINSCATSFNGIYAQFNNNNSVVFYLDTATGVSVWNYNSQGVFGDGTDVHLSGWYETNDTV